MTEQYQVSSAYIRLMLQADNELAEQIPSELFAQLASALEQDHVAGSLINKLFEALESLGVSSWAAQFSQQLSIANHGALGFAALSAPDLATALEVLSEFSAIRSSGISNVKSPLISPDTQTTSTTLKYTYIDRTKHTLAGRWLLEAGFLVAQNLIENMTAHPLGDNAKICFAYPKPRGSMAIERLLHARCIYNAGENSMSIPQSWSKIPSPLRDADSFRTNLAKCREMKLKLSIEKDDVLKLVSTRLLNHFDRRLINQAKSETIPSLDQLANELHMSPRTLIRKLALQQSSYKNILDGIRKQHARMLLKETHLTSAEIAYKLGYGEAANFGRAFRRWTGQSPTKWRRV